MYQCRRPAAVVVDVFLPSNIAKPQSRDATRRLLHYDGRQRLSNFWTPASEPANNVTEDANSLLIRGGYLRQAYSGIFHLLPLGLRVQNKLERLIDNHMTSLGAAKVSLSTISSQNVWSQSGRLDKGSEFFKFEDRKGSQFLLSPTHEEEITQLVAKEIKSYRDLPIRLYQVSRKYRDEKRPRQGLLRGREFLMKDLYTFDADETSAHSTYEKVREAYSRFFDELKVPYLVANADSGSMGGDLSHEYHFPNEKGEDDIISCGSCEYVRNEELVDKPPPTIVEELGLCGDLPDKSKQATEEEVSKIPEHLSRWQGVTEDGLGAIDVFFPQPYEVNPYAVKAVVPNLDLSGATTWQPMDIHAYLSSKSRGEHGYDEAPEVPQIPSRTILFDNTITPQDRDTVLNWYKHHSYNTNEAFALHHLHPHPSTKTHPLNLKKPLTSDPCPRCSPGRLTVQKAIEVGHTFHLGTRYSEPLNCNIATPAPASPAKGSSSPSSMNKASDPAKADQTIVPAQMGCHGIGLSRLISAVASCLVDDTGLNWPRVMAPFEVVVISNPKHEDVAPEIYDRLSSTGSSGPDAAGEMIDVVLDDRPGKPLVWKLKDADLVGYPIIVVIGKAFGTGKVEVQCRRLGVKENVELEGLRGFVGGLLRKL